MSHEAKTPEGSPEGFLPSGWDQAPLVEFETLSFDSDETPVDLPESCQR